MAAPTCIKCSGHSFEVALFAPVGENYKLSMVQCSNCGVPVGVLDTNIHIRIEAVKSQIAAVDQRMAKIAAALSQ